MSETQSAPRLFRFGEFEADVRTGELRKGGVRLKLSGQPFQVLAILLEHSGDVVTREELQKQLWPDTFVDIERNLNGAINRVREVLGDSRENPQFIETLPRRGYRFIALTQEFDSLGGSFRTAQLQPQEKNGSAPVLDASETRSGKKSPLNWRKPAFALALLGLAAAAWYLFRPLPAPRISEYKQITRDGHRKLLAGTDGSRVYFNQVDPQPAISDIAISGGKSATITLPLPNPRLLDVSPDGSTLLVTSRENGPPGLWAVQIPGGSMRRLANGPILSAVWSPDGRTVGYATRDGDIYVVKCDGTGVPKRVGPEQRNGSVGVIRNLAWSPNGASLRFTLDDRFWEISTDGSERHPLLPDWHPSSRMCCGRWTRDGNFYLFLVQGDFHFLDFFEGELWALDERRTLLHRGAVEPIQLEKGPIRWSTLIPGKDEKTLFARGVINRGELVRYDAQSRELKPWLGGISAEQVSYSPDGKFVVYVSYPEGILWRANLDGSDPVQLTGAPFSPLLPHWSPDGSTILFFDISNDRGRQSTQSYIVSSQGGTPRPILPDDKQPQIDPNWSPDGKKIVFASGKITNSNSGLFIRVFDLASRETVTLPGSQGIYSPRWSPDGRFIAGLKSSGGISVFEFATQRWSQLQKGFCGYPSWSSDSRFVYFFGSLSTGLGVYRVRVQGGNAELVVDLNGFRHTGTIGSWMGLDPSDTPMLIRDTGSEEIYSLTLEQK
jgi:Tol biopolymer transport system component/DNA-binding winged helix-turn-helix (wHTH) protein